MQEEGRDVAERVEEEEFIRIGGWIVGVRIGLKRNHKSENTLINLEKRKRKAQKR